MMIMYPKPRTELDIVGFSSLQLLAGKTVAFSYTSIFVGLLRSPSKQKAFLSWVLNWRKSEITSDILFTSYSVGRERKTLTSSSPAHSPYWPLQTSWSSPTSTRASSLVSPSSTLSLSIHLCTVWYEEETSKHPMLKRLKLSFSFCIQDSCNLRE